MKSPPAVPGRPDDDTLLSLLRCPVTQQNLVRAGDGSLVTPDGARSYPVGSGVPVVIVPERSLFGAEAQALAGGAARSRGGWIVEACGAAARRLVPPISRNVKARENFRQLAQHLTSLEGERAIKRVLVVGGAVTGAGIEQLLSAPLVETVETDVVVGPRTQVVCDAHDLPFADGSFDAVVCQAVLGNVVDPDRVVTEIHRVLTTDGFVYSETNFLQAVCMGAYDFTRHTYVGHRRLFRRFDELSSGVQCGPGMALAWMVVWFFMTLGGRSRVARAVARGVVPFFVFWLPLLDRYLVDKPGAYDAASGTFFLGRRRADAVPDEEIIRGYRGAVRTSWIRAREDYAADDAMGAP
jgi:SAM-dependent methyltransferase/uncharacterized protein YbaR (Trm112 family)